MDEPIRILHAVSKMDMNGIETFIMNVYRNIDRNKIQFDFLDHTAETGYYDSEIYSLGGKIFKLNKLSLNYFFQYQKNLNIFFEQHHEYKIIHSHLNLLSAFTLKAAKKANINCRISHSHSSFFSNKGIKKIVKKYAKSKINIYTTDRFACSESAGIWQFGINEWNANNITIIPNGIDLTKFKFSSCHRKKIRNTLKINDSEIVFGHSGRFIDVKNHQFIIDIFFNIHKNIKNSKLILLGDGNLKNKIKKKVNNMLLIDSVIFIDPTENIHEYLSAMDCFIFPSKYEGLGISLIEAQTSGLFCFISDIIPHESKIGEKTIKLPLSKNSKYWANFIINKLNNSNLKNRNIPKKAIFFDIKKVAKYLENFYLKKYKK